MTKTKCKAGRFYILESEWRVLKRSKNSWGVLYSSKDEIAKNFPGLAYRDLNITVVKPRSKKR